MRTVEYKGYTVSQAERNNHIMIVKDEKMIMHIPATEPKTSEQLKGYVDFYLKMAGACGGEQK